MAVSGNGWPVDPNPANLGIETMTINGVGFPVRGGEVRQLLEYVATQVSNRVERANATYGCWGYSYRMNVNSPGSWSNHASGTAIDYNATRHPNGVPTAATFTQAQIDEIHKILAEVNGAVRWGGDYSGTPDAMHFEINVSPSELDVTIDPSALPAGASTPAGYGAPTLEDGSKLPVLTENSVSLPTLMNYGHGYAQWLFRPTQTGSISIDGMLSHYSDPKIEALNPGGPAIRLYIFPVSYGSDGSLIPIYAEEVEAAAWPGDDTHPARNTGQMTVEVEAGRTYVIRATTTPEWPWIKAVIRIGSYAQVSDWITPPTMEAVITVRHRFKELSQYPTYSLYFPSVIDSNAGPDWMYATGDAGWIYTNVLRPGPRFRGEYNIGTSAFGRAPWAVSAGTEAMECAWRWARRYIGGQDWSPADDMSWYGVPLSDLSFPDHIFGKGGAGSASCRFRTDVEQPQSDYLEFRDPLGVIYTATEPGVSWDGEAHDAALWGQFTNGNVIWETYAGSYYIDFDYLRWRAGPSGWGGAWAGPSWYDGTAGGYRPDYMPELFDGEYGGPTAEWESDDPAMIASVEFALDEYTFMDTNLTEDLVAVPYQAYPQDDAAGNGSVINWYVQRVDPAENVEGYTDTDWLDPGSHPVTRWGPWGNDTWYGQAVGDGPASLAASSQLLTSSSGGVGAQWIPLDPSYWLIANTRVVPFDEVGDNNVPTEISYARMRPDIPAQARFIGMPRVMLSDTMPFVPPSGYGGDDENGNPGDGLEMRDYLRGQSVALKVTLQPQRYRIIYPAEIPDLTYTGGTTIAMNSDDTGQVLY
jgi:hypothetical protein